MKNKKLVFSFILIIAMLLAFIPVSASSGSSSISVSASSLSVGDTLSVTVTVSGSNLATFVGNLSYNSSVLQYVSSSGGGTNSGGSVGIFGDSGNEAASSLSDTVIFKAIANGSSGLSVSFSEVLDWDVNDVSVSGASTNISVSGTTATPRVDGDDYEEEYEEETETKKTEEKVEEIKVTINGEDYIMLQDLEGVELPNGYGPYIFTYKDKECNGAVDSTGKIIIAYMKHATKEKSGFFVFDSYDEQFVPYTPVKATAATYVLYRLEKDVKVPSIFDIEVDNFGTGGIPAWESSDKRLENYVLFYGISPNGEKGFYMYDKQTASVQKFLAVNFEEVEETIAPVETDKDDFSKTPQSLYAKVLDDKEIFTLVALISAFAFALLIALILCIFFKKNKRINKEKFDKKMSKKQSRIEKKAEKYMQSGDAPKSEIEIDTENFDEMTDTPEIPEETNTEE